MFILSIIIIDNCMIYRSDLKRSRGQKGGGTPTGADGWGMILLAATTMPAAADIATECYSTQKLVFSCHH